MKSFKIVLILLTACALIAWVRVAADFGHIARILPFSGGFRPSIYDAAGITMVFICLWGLGRLKRRSNGGLADDR